MSRAFLAAGAHHVVVNLWPVADEPTPSFMQELFRCLREGIPVAVAPCRARIGARERGEGTGVWAAFVCVGAAP